MEQIDDIARVFQDITQQTNEIKSLNIKPEELEGNVAAKLQSSEGYLTKLKPSYIAMVAQSLFLDFLSKDQENWPNQDVTEEHITSMNADRSMKFVTEDLESDIIEAVNSLQSKQEQLQNALAELESKLTAVKSKKQEYEAVKEQVEAQTRNIIEKEKAAEAQKEREKIELQTNFAIKQCEAAIQSIEQTMEILQTEVNTLQVRVEANKRGLQEAQEQRQEIEQDRQEKRNEIEKSLQLLESLQGFKVKEIGDDSLVLEFAQTTGSPTPQLKLKFELCEMKPRLCGAEINTDSLEISDLVQSAVESRDPIVLVHGVQTRLRNYQGLRQEIDDLQKKYAMDWEPGPNRIRVMLGRSGKTVCTLVIGSSYPAENSVSLLKVENNDQQPDLLKLKPSRCNPSLSDWIEHLQEVFTTQ